MVAILSSFLSEPVIRSWSERKIHRRLTLPMAACNSSFQIRNFRPAGAALPPNKRTFADNKKADVWQQ